MSDLINRELLKQKINLNYNNHQYIDAQTMKDIINTEPTVEDKTVEELEKLKREFENREGVFTSYHFVTAIGRHISELKGENNVSE